jgi:hypothetical protein
LIRKISIYTFIFVISIYSFEWFILSGLRKSPKGMYEKLNTTFLKQNSFDVIFLGSSRMFMHLDNRLYDSVFNTNSYNIGLAGATTRISYITLKSYLVNSQKPKTLYFELDYHISHLETDSIFNFSTYIPFLQNKTLYSEFNKIDSRFFHFKYNPIYSLPHIGTGGFGASLNTWFGRTGMYDQFFEKGFFENKIKDNFGMAGHVNKNAKIGSETKMYLDSMIRFCQNNQIELIFTISPAYKNVSIDIPQHQKVITSLKKIAAKNTIRTYDFSSDLELISTESYFEDNYHMYYEGARKYTLKLCDSLKKK